MENSAMKAEKNFIKAFDAHVDAVFRFCLFKVSDKAVAQDLTQITFIRCWQQIAKGEEVKDVKAFIFTIARNLIVDHYRKNSTQSLEQLTESGYEPATIPDYQEAIDNKLELAKAKKLLSKIDQKYREAVHLRYVADLSPKEIAKILGESENTISVRIHRGIKQLRDLLN